MTRLLCLIGILLVAAACQTTQSAASKARTPAAELRAHAVSFDSGEGTQLAGYLYRPAGKGPFDTVLMMHGCAGLLNEDGSMKARESAWRDILLGEGYAVLIADSFSPRGHASICRIRDRPVRPERERPHDAYGALRWLQAQPFVRPGRVVLMGWSNGAMAMLWAVRADAPQRPAGLVQDFRAAIGFYPGCIKIRREAPDYRPAMPVLLQIGLADDWTKPKPCMALADEATARGGPAMIYDAYEGAYHGFDHPGSRERSVTTNSGGGDRSVRIGTNPEARARAIARVKAYLREAFTR